ncbi:MAG TPA: hypothetical protein VFT66_25575 [Roseiflexaceae bacterium]|jgi:hypothetical protein|nr:hypothetical protein [Roseiflexaceae bacterium]
MGGDQTTLVLVQPGDTIAAIEHNIRQAGTPSVQLLVADGAEALRTPNGFAELQQVLAYDNVDLLVFSSDAAIIRAAQANQILAVPVEGARVSFAPRSPALASPADEQALVPAVEPTADISAKDAAFLEALEQVPAGTAYDNEGDLDPSLFGGPDDYDDVDELRPVDRQDVVVDADDDWEHADRWLEDEAYDRAGMVPAETHTADRRPRRADHAAAPRDWRQQVQPLAATAPLARGTRSGTARGQVADLEDEYEIPRRRNLLGALLPLIFLLAVAAAAAFWFFSARTTVTVTPPSNEAVERSFTKEVIPLAAQNNNGNQSGAAIQAEQVAATADATVQGQASQQQVPVGVARGTVTIINRLGQPVNLPEGTEFVGTNENNQQVRFLIDAPATVPQAVTSSSLTGTSTTFGQIDVAVSARSPGSASNLPANSINQMVLPGQAPIQSGGNLTISQANPIAGGSEEQRFVVTQEDVQGVLSAALTRLYNESSISALTANISRQRYAIDPSTIMPDAQALAQPNTYRVTSVQPPVGQPIEGNNATFSVTVQADFTALAVPADQPIAQQLQTVAPEVFRDRCPPGTSYAGASIGSNTNQANQGWQWDGTTLTVNGTFSCKPVSQEIRARVLEAVRGKSYAAAVNDLEQLKSERVIGDYDLPSNKTQLPDYNFLFDIQIVPTPSTEPTSTTAQPVETTIPASDAQPTGAPQQ